MNRRDLLSSFALTAFLGDGQDTAPPSLYVPNAHRMDDRKLLHDFMEEFAFVDLITGPPLHITHIPVILDREEGPLGVIRGHIARQNEQIKTFDGKQEAVIVFAALKATSRPLATAPRLLFRPGISRWFTRRVSSIR